MNPSVERLTEQFTRLIGPEAFAKAEAAIAAAKAAAAAAAKVAAEKAAATAAAAAAAKAAVPPSPATSAAPVATPPVATTAPVAAKPASPISAPASALRPAPTAAAARPTGASVPAGAAAAPRPAAPAAPALPPPPPLPVQVVNHAAKGYDFDAIIAPDQVVKAAELLDADGFGLDAITGVDWIAQNEMEVVYDFFHPTEPLHVVIRTRVPRANPELATISTIFGGANWHERETHDFFGIRFTGHPNLKPFLLPEDADFHPLRKDYQP